MSVDSVSLTSGLAVAGLGVFALLESEGVVNLSFGWAAVVLTALLGGIFLLSGLAADGDDRHD